MLHPTIRLRYSVAKRSLVWLAARSFTSMRLRKTDRRPLAAHTRETSTKRINACTGLVDGVWLWTGPAPCVRSILETPHENTQFTRWHPY
jgi:hypothetical protein